MPNPQSLYGCLALSLSLAGACDAQSLDPSDTPEDSIFVEDGKADDFLSYTAKEYRLTAKAKVVIEPGLATASASAKLARAKELIAYKQIGIAWFLTQYLVDKTSDDENQNYGGFSGIAKAGDYESLDITPTTAGAYEFATQQIVASGPALMSQLGVQRPGDAFDLEIGKPSNAQLAQLDTNSEWYRRTPWSPWDPSKVNDDQKESLSFAVMPEPESSDAWFDYARLLADGKLEMSVYFGWDYHDSYHTKHARALFQWLVARGFKAPVTSFDKLEIGSGPFTKAIKADGKPVNISVRVVYGKAGSASDPDTAAGGTALEDAMRASLATDDVVAYSGHSGPFYGFALANWRTTAEGDLDDADIRTMQLPADKYQVILAEGCDTYQLGQAFKDNPNKQGKNVDIITTTTASNAATPNTVFDFLTALTELDSAKRLRPRTVKSLLTNLDNNSPAFNTMYGLHGVDDNPTAHPFAVRSKLDQSCSKNADCGGVGNMCASAGGVKRCTFACTADSGCPATHRCQAIASASASTIYGAACAKR